jgi:hypothetical protein
MKTRNKETQVTHNNGQQKHSTKNNSNRHQPNEKTECVQKYSIDDENLFAEAIVIGNKPYFAATVNACCA